MPTAATLELAARIDGDYSAAMRYVSGFFASDVAAADATLRTGHAQPLAQSEPDKPLDCKTAQD